MYEVPVERGKIREFARAMRSKNSSYLGLEATVPPTFLTTARLYWEPRDESVTADLGFDMKRALHAQEEFIYHGPPPRAGQTLDASSMIAERYEKEGKRGGKLRFAVIVTEFRDQGGRLVAEQRTTTVETARAPRQETP